MNPDVEKVLAEIISIGTSEDPTEHKRGVLSPGYSSLASFAALLAKEPREEALQQYLQANPQYLMALYGSNDDGDLAFICKPPIGTRYFADFCVISYSQGGAGLELVELEPSSAELFTKAGTPARRLQGAIGQIDDWRQWIQVNTTTFIRDIIELAKALPLYESGKTSGSVRFKTPEDLEHVFRGFGGFEYPHVGYSVIIGRWARLSEAHRRRLIYMNREYGGQQRVYTYDQLARQALVRPDISFF